MIFISTLVSKVRARTHTHTHAHTHPLALTRTIATEFSKGQRIAKNFKTRMKLFLAHFTYNHHMRFQNAHFTYNHHMRFLRDLPPSVLKVELSQVKYGI